MLDRYVEGTVQRISPEAPVPVVLVEGSGVAAFDITLIYCEAVAASLCLIDQVRFEVPLFVGPEGVSSQLILNRSIPNT